MITLLSTFTMLVAVAVTLHFPSLCITNTGTIWSQLPEVAKACTEKVWVM
jgi:hypothetical protein